MHTKNVGYNQCLQSEVKSENEESQKIKVMGQKKLLGISKLSARKKTNTKFERAMGQKPGE